MTRIDESWLKDAATRSVMSVLTDAGFEAYFVGGCVRNALLGAGVSDIDISTSARPETVTELAERAGLKAVPTGIEHGTVTVVSGHETFEVTTYRKDVETDGRRAVVAFADTVEDDAHRRDFTMNALYADMDGTVIDPLGGGIDDLKARHVRFIDDPAERIREDYLRILRFFRFYAWYGDVDAGLDAEGLAQCAALSAGLETISNERIGAEMRKLLAAPDPAPAIATMEAAGILARILPGATSRVLTILTGLAPDADAIVRLAALGGEDVADHLRLSKSDAKRVTMLRSEAGGTRQAGALAYVYDAASARDVLALRAALFEQPLVIDDAEIAAGANAVFPVKAADLRHLSGPALGAELRSLEARWIASGFRLEKQALLGGERE